jgi:hypothetical protein
MKPQSEKPKTSKPDDTASIDVSGHLVIRDKETGEELVKKRG